MRRADAAGAAELSSQPCRFQSSLTFPDSAHILCQSFTVIDDMKPRMRDSTDVATPAPAGWQAQKSASTRLQIVESALRCVVDLGYSCTTTTVIAEKAGLSRGAMLHHFPSKIDIVRAAVEHLHAKRLKAFRRAIDKLPRDETRVRRALEAYFEHVKHPMYVAFLELWIASRTDPELQSILKPAQEAFEREWYETAVDLFPEWEGAGANFDIALDLVHYVMDGLAVSLLTHDIGEHERRMVRYLEDRLRELSSRPAAAQA
jgi:AcrR family transcriptional regulator